MNPKKVARKITVLDKLASRKLPVNDHETFLSRLGQLEEAVETMDVNSKLVRTLSIKRTKLIDKQIEKEVFEGKLHDEYHQTTKELETHLSNFFLSIKTVMNRVPNIVRTALDQKDSRSIKTSTFGKFKNSLRKLTERNTKLKKYFSKAVVLGEKLDEEIITYRDKYIEHVQHTYDNNLLSSDGPASVIKSHMSSKSKKSRTGPVEVIKGKPHWTKFDLVSEDDLPIGYYYYIHFSISKKLQSGKKIEKGDPIGRCYDSDLGHFKKWGTHSHVFSTPNLRRPDFPGEVVAISPGIEPAKEQTLKVVLSFLEACFNYLSSIHSC